MIKYFCDACGAEVGRLNDLTDVTSKPSGNEPRAYVSSATAYSISGPIPEFCATHLCGGCISQLKETLGGIKNEVKFG